MNQASATKYRWEDLPRERLKPDLERRLISTERLMVAHVYLQKGCIVPTHSHENEQLTYILEGLLRFFLGDDGSEVVDVAAGEVLHLPSHLPHKARSGRRSVRASGTSRSRSPRSLARSRARRDSQRLHLVRERLVSFVAPGYAFVASIAILVILISPTPFAGNGVVPR